MKPLEPLKKFSDRLKKPLVCGFILVQTFLMIGGSLPDPDVLLSRALDALSPYQNFIGFYQGWSMFAPYPGGENSYVDANVDFSDGTHTVWTFPRPTQMGFLEKSLVGEKYRKLGQEKLLPFQNFELWNDVSRFVIADLHGKFPGKEVVVLQFYRHSNTVPPPEKTFISHGVLSKDYDTQSIFQYKLPVNFSYETKNTP